MRNSHVGFTEGNVEQVQKMKQEKRLIMTWQREMENTDWSELENMDETRCDSTPPPKGRHLVLSLPELGAGAGILGSGRG